MPIFGGNKIKVHESLKELHAFSSANPLCGAECDEQVCLNYVGCGDFEPDMPHKCPFPCKACLVWEGYGWEGRNVGGLVKILQDKAKA